MDPVKNSFKFPMLRSERIIGLIYIPVHIFLLPYLISFFLTQVFRNPEATAGMNANLIYYIVSFLFVLIFLFRYLKTSFTNLFDNLLNAVRAMVLAYLFNFALMYLIGLLLSLVAGDAVNPNTRDIVSQTKLNKNSVIVVAVPLAPVGEETLFRGALFGTLRSKSRTAAYILTALVFSVYHLWQYFLGGFEWSTLLFLLQYIPASLALCWCYEKSGSIWAPMLLHAGINFIQLKIVIG
jgi:membrane protease YdiL (CAAX protease family)